MQKHKTMATELEKLVDDYIAKHDAAIAANNARSRALRECWPQKEKDAALQTLFVAHSARAVALRALRDARKKG
jgi:hypothetical protein